MQANIFLDSQAEAGGSPALIAKGFGAGQAGSEVFEMTVPDNKVSSVSYSIDGDMIYMPLYLIYHSLCQGWYYYWKRWRVNQKSANKIWCSHSGAYTSYIGMV